MSKIKRLIASYKKYIAIPWRSDAAAAQRVIFCVYNESDELRLRAKIDEFFANKRGARSCPLTPVFELKMRGADMAMSAFKKWTRFMAQKRCPLIFLHCVKIKDLRKAIFSHIGLFYG